MTPTTLYRHFAGDGSLLYVGISLSWPQRTKAHAKGSHWFDQVAKVEIERFETREDALRAEREAIISERPQFNIIHNRPRSEKCRAPHKPKRAPNGDPLLQTIKGPDALVGPALVYKGNAVSVMVAHGTFGSPGHITEIVLGELAADIPDALLQACDTVISVRSSNEITIDEARKLRSGIIQRLRKFLQCVEAYDSDLTLAVANAARFPSNKSRQILHEVSSEREALA